MNKCNINELEHIWRQIMRLADNFNDCSQSDLPNRLPLSQLRVVGVIYNRHPDGVMLKEIAEELGLTPGAISQTVDILVREKIVERTTSPSDRRAILLRPTAMGLQLKEQHSNRINQVIHEISKDIAQKDFETFVRVLDQLQHNIGILRQEKINQNNKIKQ